MRRLLPCLSLLMLPLAQAADTHTHHEHDHQHGSEYTSLGAHDHGVASLDMVLEDGVLLIELLSPAINLLGFEHAPHSAAEQQQVAELRATLAAPQALFGLPPACRLAQQALSSPLLGTPSAGAADTGHSDIRASYRFDCGAAERLATLDFSALFQRFPATERIQVQLIAPAGQQGLELTPRQSQLNF